MTRYINKLQLSLRKGKSGLDSLSLCIGKMQLFFCPAMRKEDLKILFNFKTLS